MGEYFNLIICLFVLFVENGEIRRLIKKTPPKRGLGSHVSNYMPSKRQSIMDRKGGSYSGVSLGKPTIPVKRISRSTMPETPITR